MIGQRTSSPWRVGHNPPPHPQQPPPEPQRQHNDDGGAVDHLPVHTSWFDTGMPTGPAFGEPEDMIWGSLKEVLSERREGGKDGTGFVPARFKPEPNSMQVRRKGANLIARTLVVLDIETDKRTGEVPPPPDDAAGRVRKAGWAGVAYTSHNHRADAPRYRVVVPLAGEIDPELPAVEVVADALGLTGVCDRSKTGASSLFYAPSAEPGQLDRHRTIIIDGAPIDTAWIRETAGKLLDERRAEEERIAAAARADAEARRQAKIAAGFDPNDSVIERLRACLGDLEQILLSHGYEKSGSKFRHPGSTSGQFGADIKRFGGIERVYSFNATDPLHRDNLPAWCGGVTALDAVDVAVILKFSGDRTRALRELAARFGLSSARERGDGGQGKANGEGTPPPDGPDDHDSSTSWADQAPEKPWPKMPAEAFHGLAGEVVDAIAPHTEADRVALLMHYLTMVGNVIGRKPYYAVGATRHYAVLNALLIGKTARARKGTARNDLTPLLALVDPDWAENCQHSGLSSGEGLIMCAHDQIVSREKVSGGKGQPPRYVTVVKEEAVEDKRAMVVEPEFGGTLIAMGRDGNLLSRVMREFWDCQKVVQTKTKASPSKATDAHVSILGHITIGELQRRLDFQLFTNGFVNRFLLALVQRSKLLPFGGEPARDVIAELARRTQSAVQRASIMKIGFSDKGRARWEAVYHELSRDLVGLVDDALARAEAQTIRLAMLYCLLDCRSDIEAAHIDAALAVWRYCEASTRYLFGDLTGDPVADEILAALRRSVPDGMTRSQINDLFSGHRNTARIGRALATLLQHNKVRTQQRPTQGRPVEIWHAV